MSRCVRYFACVRVETGLNVYSVHVSLCGLCLQLYIFMSYEPITDSQLTTNINNRLSLISVLCILSLIEPRLTNMLLLECF